MTYFLYAAEATEGTWHRVTREYVDAVDVPNPPPEGMVVAEHPKGTTYNAPTVVPVGWYVDVDNVFNVARHLPVRSGVDAQRDEIKQIVREFLAAFTVAHFDGDGATVVRKYARMVLAYALNLTADSDLDAAKTAARAATADQIALYADSTWAATLDTPGLRVFALPEPLTPGTAAPPAAESLTATLTAQQITAVNVAQVLG